MGNIKSSSPNFSRYTIEELKDVLAHIDQAQFPERYEEAKTVLARKLDNPEAEPIDDIAQPTPTLSKPKWSEQHLITRTVMGWFLVMTFSVIPITFYEFMTAKSWTENTMGLIWLQSITLIVMWFMSLKKDPKLKLRLEQNWRGQLAIVVMPLLFLLMSWLFIDKSLPLGLHFLSLQQEVQYDMDYKKRSGKNNCRYRLKIIESDKLEDADLCMTKNQRDSLPERGKITVIGTRSQFGMVIDGFTLP